MFDINSMILRLQKRNPLNMCCFFPIDPNELKVVLIDNKLMFKIRQTKLNLPVIFDSNCNICFQQYTLPYSKRVPHFAKNHYLIYNDDVGDLKAYIKKFVLKRTIVTLTPSLKPSLKPSLSRKEEKEEKEEKEVKLNCHEKIAHIKTTKNKNNDKIKNLIIGPHPLDNRFSIGTFFNFKIIIRNYDGYVQANSIRVNKEGLGPDDKSLSMWQKNNKTKELIEVFSKYLEIPENELIMRETSVTNTLRGIYIHPKLIVDFAYWVSVEFKIYTQEIVTNFMSKEAKNKLRNEIKELRIKNGEQVDEIKELKERIIDIQKTVHKTDNTLNKAFEFISDRMIDNNRLAIEVEDKYTHLFIISKFISDNEPESNYVIFRIQKKTRANSIAKKEFEYNTKLDVLYEIKTPNPVELTSKIIEIKGVNRRHSILKLTILEDFFLFQVSRLVKKDVDNFQVIKDHYYNY